MDVPLRLVVSVGAGVISRPVAQRANKRDERFHPPPERATSPRRRVDQPAEILEPVCGRTSSAARSQDATVGGRSPSAWAGLIRPASMPTHARM